MDRAEEDAADAADAELSDAGISEVTLCVDASELDSGGVDVAVGEALLVEGGGVGDALGLGLLLVEGGRKLLLLNVVPRLLATELASDKMLLQIAEYDGSSEKGTKLQSPSVVVDVVAVAEQPSAMEHVISPQLVVRMVLPGVAVFVTFHVEHDCVQMDTDDAEHELELDAVPVIAFGLSLIQNGPTQLGLGRHDPTQLGGGTGGKVGGWSGCQYNAAEDFR
jgi:hypothetical protein